MNTPTRIMNSHWLSWGLLVIAYATFGRLLHTTHAPQYAWGIVVAMIITKAAVLTLLWPPLRKFVLMGFQSDAGYSIMVLVLASLAVLAVVQIRAFAYGVVLIATSILVRVDCLIKSMGDRASFGALVLLPVIGIGLSWIPPLLHQGFTLINSP